MKVVERGSYRYKSRLVDIIEVKNVESFTPVAVRFDVTDLWSLESLDQIYDSFRFNDLSYVDLTSGCCYVYTIRENFVESYPELYYSLKEYKAISFVMCNDYASVSALETEDTYKRLETIERYSRIPNFKLGVLIKKDDFRLIRVTKLSKDSDYTSNLLKEIRRYPNLYRSLREAGK